MTAFLSLRDAIAEYIHDGATLAMEGFTHLIPFAAGHEIIRQHKSDLCLLRPDPQTKELVVTSIHQGITRDDIAEQTGWQVRFADTIEQTAPPTGTELAVLRDLQARTERAHAGKESATPHAGAN